MGRTLFVALLALAVAGVALPSSTMPAAAQGFLERLLGPRFERPPRFPPGNIGREPPRFETIGEPQAPAKPVVPKNDDARKVMVIGDFLAASLAAGLEQTFAEDPTVAVVDKTSGSSGLVRDDHYDWNQAIVPLINDVHPDYIVVMIGANDRQQLRLPGNPLELRTAEWERVYKQRVAALADTLKTYGRPFFWVSAPPVSRASMAADLTYFNGLYKAEVDGAGGHFVDIWNGFVDEQGQFARRGPDVDGQVQTLRGSDGMNFTRAGRNKLAYYVEREIQRVGGLNGGSGLLASTTPGDRIEVGPDGERIWVGPVLSLSGPALGASDTLAGGPEERSAASDGESPLFKLVVEGDALPQVAGRVDDFTWPSPRHQVAAIEEAPKIPSYAEIRDGVPIPPRKPR